MAPSQMRRQHTQGRGRIRPWLEVWDSSSSHIALSHRARNSNNYHSSSILELVENLLRGLLGKYRNSMYVFVCRENVIPIQTTPFSELSLSFIADELLARPCGSNFTTVAGPNGHIGRLGVH